MKQFLYLLGLYFKNRTVVIAHSMALIGISLCVWILSTKIDDLPGEVPLWYSTEPINQLTEVGWLWIIPSVSAFILMVNLIVGLWLYRRYATVSQMLAVMAAGVSLLSVVAVIKTVLIFTDLL